MAILEIFTGSYEVISNIILFDSHHYNQNDEINKKPLANSGKKTSKIVVVHIMTSKCCKRTIKQRFFFLLSYRLLRTICECLCVYAMKSIQNYNQNWQKHHQSLA